MKFKTKVEVGRQARTFSSVKAVMRYANEVEQDPYPDGHQEITICSATGAAPWIVNTIDEGVPHRRPLTFASLAKVRAFVEGFDVDKLTIQIGDPLPPIQPSAHYLAVRHLRTSGWTSAAQRALERVQGTGETVQHHR